LKEIYEVNSKERSIASWLSVDNEGFKIKINRLPEKEDLTLPINEQLIVELYSK
jgi:small subunit ribosomal protein S4